MHNVDGVTSIFITGNKHNIRYKNIYTTQNGSSRVKLDQNNLLKISLKKLFGQAHTRFRTAQFCSLMRKDNWLVVDVNPFKTRSYDKTFICEHEHVLTAM